MHARGVTLKNEDAIVQICDQAWKAVSFSMDKPASILVLGLKQAEIFPDSHSLCNAAVPPSSVRTSLVERHHSHGDACIGCIMAPAKNGALVGANTNPVA